MEAELESKVESHPESKVESHPESQGNQPTLESDGEETTQQNSSSHQSNDQSDENSNKKFEKVMNDFIKDLLNSFPEFKEKLSIHYEDNELKTQFLYDYCKRVYPERFFDFLYKNEDIVEDEAINTEILPALDLKEIWNVEGITDSIKETIWKYLQLIMFSIVGDINDKSVFGDTSKLFEAINEDDFKSKMEDTMKDLFELFQNNESNGESSGESARESNGTPEFLNPENMQEHISSLLGGKLGKLASEIAEETAKELDIDLENVSDSEDVMKQLLSNPQKLMGLVKKVGGKLDSKIQSGDIKESELMEEAGQLMKKMKDMPGMKNMGDMMKNMGIPDGSMDQILRGMGMPSGGKKAKINMGAYNSMMRKQEAIEKVKEKAKAHVEKRKEDLRIKQEMEELRKNYIAPTSEEIDNLLKELNLDDNEPKVESSTKKKKKKKKNKN
jgi:hypothetical protein